MFDLAQSLIGIHAAFGEVGAVAFVWVFVELLSPTESRIRRAKIAAGIGVLFLLLSWFTGGYYYVVTYGPMVKPLIKAGPMPWAHTVITEAKEHIFLFLPFLALLTWGSIKKFGTRIVTERNIRIGVVLLSGLIVLLTFAMAGMGFMISSGARSALENKTVPTTQQ